MAFKTMDIRDKSELTINISDYTNILLDVKAFEKLIWDLNTTSIESKYSNKGQNAYHPKMLLSIIFYGYSKGIRSGRSLAQKCKENLNYIYLSRGYQISKSTFNEFRQTHYQIFANLFVQIVSKSIDLNLCDAGISLVDGSKLLANCSKKRTKTQEKYEKLALTLKSDIEELEKELALQNLKKDNNNQTSVLKQISHQTKLLEKVEERITELSATDNKTKLNLTDKDAPIMKGKKGEFDTFYNVQVGCCENQIITFNDTVTDACPDSSVGNDKRQLIPTLKGIAQNTNQQIEKALVPRTRERLW